jgi:hypothetical protein
MVSSGREHRTVVLRWLVENSTRDLAAKERRVRLRHGVIPTFPLCASAARVPKSVSRPHKGDAEGREAFKVARCDGASDEPVARSCTRNRLGGWGLLKRSQCTSNAGWIPIAEMTGMPWAGTSLICKTNLCSSHQSCCVQQTKTRCRVCYRS